MQKTGTIQAAYFREPKPAAIRLWHWLTFLFFTGSVITVLFASTLFQMKSNVGMIQEQVQSKGGTVTVQQARSVAHEYSDKLWMLHKYFGFGLSILLLWRIITEVMLAKEGRLRTRVRNALNYPAKDGEQKHYLWVQYGYVIFYILFITMSLTGLILAFEDIKWLEPLHDLAQDTHSIVQWGLYAYVLFHLGGVIRADLTRYGGIISRMINGKNS